jgi:hypothetical protein
MYNATEITRHARGRIRLILIFRVIIITIYTSILLIVSKVLVVVVISFTAFESNWFMSIETGFT